MLGQIIERRRLLIFKVVNTLHALCIWEHSWADTDKHSHHTNCDGCDRVCIHASFAFFHSLSLSLSVPIAQMGSQPERRCCWDRCLETMCVLHLYIFTLCITTWLVVEVSAADRPQRPTQRF